MKVLIISVVIAVLLIAIAGFLLAKGSHDYGAKYLQEHPEAAVEQTGTSEQK